jgi:phosphoglycolate phosphatase
MRNKKLVVFDMDGTLIDSSLGIANSINYVREHLGLDHMPQKEIISHINDHTINPAKFFYESQRLEPMHEKYFSAYYTANHNKELRLYHGIPQLLRWLKERGILIALATNAYRNSAMESLQNFGIDELFDAVVCADDVARSKPAPDMLYKILEKLDTGMADAIFVGDGPRDEEAALAAGMDYLMVDWGFTEHNSAKQVIRSVDELKNILKTLIKTEETEEE